MRNTSEITPRTRQEDVIELGAASVLTQGLEEGREAVGEEIGVGIAED